MSSKEPNDSKQLVAQPAPRAGESSTKTVKKLPDAAFRGPLPTTGHESKPKPGEESPFLEAFGDKSVGEEEKHGPVLDNQELEKRFEALVDARERCNALEKRMLTEPPAAARQAAAESAKLQEQLDKDLARFQKDVGQARKARPNDGVPQWLTGELLIFVGGEPEEMLPYFHHALAAGLKQPRLFASLARALIESNQFGPAYETALQALDTGSQDPYIWSAFARAAVALEKFAMVIDQVERAFPEQPPAWAAKMRRDAMLGEAHWQAEQRLRRAEQQADNLPRVRLVIEHRRYARKPGGGVSNRVESTGKGEVILELFEDQAPNTVANFLRLIADKAYDGTRFYLAEPAALVAGGDPRTTTADAHADGTGGPGYAIADEYQRPSARRHFRGSLGMVNTGPNTAGSQFFITLVPLPEMDGRFTVLGRVIEGQEVVDRITPGRTNRNVGSFGRLVPGDLLVRAEVIRQRPHVYTVQKVQGP